MPRAAKKISTVKKTAKAVQAKTKLKERAITNAHGKPAPERALPFRVMGESEMRPLSNGPGDFDGEAMLCVSPEVALEESKRHFNRGLTYDLLNMNKDRQRAREKYFNVLDNDLSDSLAKISELFGSDQNDAPILPIFGGHAVPLQMLQHEKATVEYLHKLLKIENRLNSIEGRENQPHRNSSTVALMDGQIHAAIHLFRTALTGEIADCKTKLAHAWQLYAPSRHQGY